MYYGLGYSLRLRLRQVPRPLMDGCRIVIGASFGCERSDSIWLQPEEVRNVFSLGKIVLDAKAVDAILKAKVPLTEVLLKHQNDKCLAEKELEELEAFGGVTAYVSIITTGFGDKLLITTDFESRQTEIELSRD